MEHWTSRGFQNLPRRSSIMHAIAEHDQGWMAVDATPLVDVGSGRLFDFISAPIAVRQSVWPRGVRMLADDPAAAALVAEHALSIYSRFRSEPSWGFFFSELEMLRDQYARRASMPREEVAEEYF